MQPDPDLAKALKDAVRGELVQVRESVDFRRKADAYRHVFEKTDRIVSGKPINVTLSQTNLAHLKDVAGWTDGETIFLNAEVLQRDLSALRGKDTTAAVLTLKGVNYHELSHVLYSPRVGDDICKKVIERATTDKDPSWWYAFNALEDQRIETWFVATYRPAHRYFEAIALKWLIKNHGGGAEGHLMVHGRKFLPTKVRMACLAAFEGRYGKALADEASDIIDEYLTVAFPMDTNKAFTLIKKFRALLAKVAAQMGGQPLPDLMTADNGPQLGIPAKGHQRDDLIRKGRTLHQDQKNARSAVREMTEQVEAEDAKFQAEAGEGEGDAQPGEGEGDGDGEAACAGEGEPASGAADGPRSNQDSGAPSTAVGAGSGVSTSTGNAIHTSEGTTGAKADWRDAVGARTHRRVQDAVDAMYDALEEALNDQDLLEDVKNTMGAVRAMMVGGQGNVGGAYGNYTHQDIPVGHAGLSKKLVHVLRRIQVDMEPTWMKRQTKGRIDVRRFIQRKPHEIDVFGTWDEGSEEEAGTEVVVLVDLSGSMSGLIGQASEALWVLKRAFDEVDIRTTVIGYSDDHVVLYKPEDKVRKQQYRFFKTISSTNPTTALREALQLFTQSQQPNKVLITITDGQWGGNDAAILALVGAINRLGAVTMLLGLQGAVARYGRHGHEMGKDMHHIKELPRIVTDLVGGILHRIGQRV